MLPTLSKIYTETQFAYERDIRNSADQITYMKVFNITFYEVNDLIRNTRNSSADDISEIIEDANT